MRGATNSGDVIEIGRRLTEAKVLAGHGGWLPWLEREFGWSDDTANNYMNLYRATATGRLQIPNGSEFEIRSLYLLASKNIPTVARDAIIERAESAEGPFTARSRAAAIRINNPELVVAGSFGAAAEAWGLAEREGRVAERGQIGRNRSPTVGDLITTPRDHFAALFGSNKVYVEQARALLKNDPPAGTEHRSCAPARCSSR
ncbi:MAG: DUF3102 domain-containing protein [Hyphomicrobiales bacterium]|nr:DUF3102 domain-containing protein [Hyphomicrobiales bacterium]